MMPASLSPTVSGSSSQPSSQPRMSRSDHARAAAAIRSIEAFVGRPSETPSR
jgi:hypothetical protein